MNRSASVVPVLALAALLAAGAPARAHAAPAAAKRAPTTAPAVEPRMVVPFLHDDWPRAMERARQRGLPVFVEAWAPW